MIITTGTVIIQPATASGSGHERRREGGERRTDPAYAAPVDGLEVAIAQADTHGGTGDAHGRRNRKAVDLCVESACSPGPPRQSTYRSKNDGRSGAQLGGHASSRRKERDLVTKDGHDCKSLSSIRAQREETHCCSRRWRDR